MKNVKTSLNTIIILIVLCLLSCATTTPLAPWSTQGITRIFIDAPESLINQNVRFNRGIFWDVIEIKTLTSIIEDSGNFRVVNTREQADAILKIEIIDKLSEASTWFENQNRKRGHDYTVLFVYSLIRSRDGAILGTRSHHDFVRWESSLSHNMAERQIISILNRELPQRLRAGH